MTRFAIVRDLGALSDLMDSLEAWTTTRSPLVPPPSPLTGVWIEHPAEAAVTCRASALPLEDGPARLRLQMGPGQWMICLTEQAVSAATLITELKAASAVTGETRARFVPVYGSAMAPATWGREWLELASRYPDLVRPPMLCDERGRLSLADPLPVSPHAEATPYAVM